MNIGEMVRALNMGMAVVGMASALYLIVKIGRYRWLTIPAFIACAYVGAAYMMYYVTGEFPTQDWMRLGFTFLLAPVAGGALRYAIQHW